MIKCDYCGADGPDEFWIGAKRAEDSGFTMVEGTGKMACSACYPRASADGEEAVRRATGLA